MAIIFSSDAKYSRYLSAHDTATVTGKVITSQT